jgi:asparagine synthase (glutamine-hydrolysing)
MCGIAGVFNFTGQHPPRAALESMGEAIVHRGPDGHGVEILGACGLAHQRLAILDLSEAGRQPMSTKDGKLWIAHNGEVYNYLELRIELEKLGHTFVSETDTEVILTAYRQWGRDAFSKFNGMWGMAIYDTESRMLTLSRDRLGIKPLFVHFNKERVIFGSEIKALLAYDSSLAQLDLDKAGRFLEHSFLPYDPDTFFVGVHSLDASSVLEISADGTRDTFDFWKYQPPVTPNSMTPEHSAEALKDLLTDSLKLRFRSDVPVGTCLSGGLDSSSIVALSAKKLGLQPETFSAVYLEEKYNEAEFVRIMVREFGLKGHEVSPNGTNLDQISRDIIYHQESPVYGPGLYSQWQVMKLAAPHVTVLLDGQGGDELFGGYFYYFPHYGQLLLDRAKSGDIQAGLELLRTRNEVRQMTGVDHFGNLLRRIPRKHAKRIIGVAKSSSIRGVRRLVEPFPALHDVFKSLRAQDNQLGAPTTAGPKIVTTKLWEEMLFHTHSYKTPAVITKNGLTDKLWADVTKLSIPALLRYEDRNSMAYSLEARVPLLDHRIVEFAFGVPYQHKIEATWTKQIMRKATQGILPEVIRTRKNKMGYPTPFATWLRTPDNESWLRDVLASHQFQSRNYVSRSFVEGLINEHVQGKKDHSWQLCRMISFEMFCQQFLDQPFKAVPTVRRQNHTAA